MSVTAEQRIVINFHMKLGKIATEIYDLLKEMYGNESLSHARVLVWFKRFQNGREDVEDDSRLSHPPCQKWLKMSNKSVIWSDLTVG